MSKYLLCFLFPLHSFAQDLQLEKLIDSLVGPFNRPDAPGTMVLIAQDGKPVLKKAYGLASLELNVPLRTDHAFAIGSVSKQFTAVAILQLVHQGKMKLSDDVRKYLPRLNTQGHTITIDNLLSHTSGISSTERKGFTGYGVKNGVAVHPDDYLSYIMSEKLLFPPGTDWSYNNAAYRINAILVEAVSGQKFGDYMKEHVFQPAGMMNTYIASDLLMLYNLPASYSRGYGGKWRNENRRPLWEWPKGSGNIISTMEDMLKWDIALREEKVLPGEWIEKAWTPYTLKNGEKVNYGYGWDISDLGDYRIIFHGGTIYGYSNESIHIPEKKLYLFYATCYFADPAANCKKILSRMLGIPFPKAMQKPEADLNDYVGSYHMNHPGLRIDRQISDRPIYANVTTSGDTLYIQYTARERSFLRPAGKDQFLPGRSADIMYVFNRDAKGKVASIEVRPFLIGNPVKEKSKKQALLPQPTFRIVSVKPEILKNYSGTYYRTEGDAYYFIEMEGNKLYAFDISAGQKVELLPVSDQKFIRKGIEDVSFNFKKNDKGIMILTLTGNRTSDFRKIAE